jgi:hypothetical protein
VTPVRGLVVRLPFWLRFSLLLALSGTPACVCSTAHRTPAEAPRDFGDPHALAPLPDAPAYLGLARYVLARPGTPPAAPPPPAPGRRAFLLFFSSPAKQDGVVAASANGTTLEEAVRNAATAMAPKLHDAQVGTGRLELDVPTTLEGTDLREDLTEPLTAIGQGGIFVANDAGKSAFVLPGEIIERALFEAGSKEGPPGLAREKILRLLAARAGVSEEEVLRMRAYRFETDAHVENPGRDGALAVYRGMVVRPAEATPEMLLAAVRRGADYLVRILNTEGRYIYMYRAGDDHDDSSYGWLRHAGTTYALFEAYEEFHDPAHAQAGERALRYLQAHLASDAASSGKYIVDGTDEEQQRTGGAGLALLAFAKHAATTGKRDNLETMRALARFIMKQQYADGHFRSNADLDDGSRGLKKEPIYYPGEGMLGLLRLYAIDPQPAYLDTVRRGADWILKVRDANVSVDNQEHDHWMEYVLNDLYRVTHDDAYLAFAGKIADAIRHKQHRAESAGPPDWVGLFYEGQTTLAATRLEAYDSAAVLGRFAGKPDGWLLDDGRQVAAAMLGQQYDRDNDYWLPNADKARGGVRESLYVADVRIDYVQHAMSAWLHLARILRDPMYGRAGVPSQDPVVSGAAASTP